MHVSRSGLTACAHFNIQYPMPLGPGAEESEVVLRVEAISLGVISVQVLVGVGGGSFSCMVCISGGFSGKNCCWKICAL
jgi:hypothetical protein